MLSLLLDSRCECRGGDERVCCCGEARLAGARCAGARGYVEGETDWGRCRAGVTMRGWEGASGRAAMFRKRQTVTDGHSRCVRRGARHCEKGATGVFTAIQIHASAIRFYPSWHFQTRGDPPMTTRRGNNTDGLRSETLTGDGRRAAGGWCWVESLATPLPFSPTKSPSPAQCKHMSLSLRTRYWLQARPPGPVMRYNHVVSHIAKVE
ncbi:hypothetical protein T440DRAFT_141136 [Plenodomus tracheiphilus IPT5]|uniref:Uncharacterized protein n=1 Tax=Plenodomus tracheiphilus IPT5 TaxID=1408161 RepID=A0A6A7B3I1_9PLEO|nr:hypothetical protein T440DRAFT_141136 [Plenodomus tracheiphilus IPT5]